MSEQGVDILWVLLSAVLVAFMQPGFTALEAGATRAKNSISTAIKNLSDFLIAFLIFVFFGASMMLGNSLGGWLGWQPLFFYQYSLTDLTLVLFHAMFASTAVTIISGAVAERTKYVSYLIIAVIVSLFIYPIQAHWIWHESGWLAQLGFIDFAGSTVVHSVGGWAALAAILIIGPRIGRFDDDAQSHRFEHSNLAYSALGVFLIWLGWIGFNGGSVLALNVLTGQVILNTMIAGAMGGISGLVISRLLKGYYQVDAIMYGILSGLVAITASAHLANPYASVGIGILGYLAYLVGQNVLAKLKIDDAIEAVPVHLFAGVAGTLAIPFLQNDKPIVEQLQIQLLGIVSVGLLSFLVTFAMLWIINRFIPLRVSESDEIMGLNISEHQASTSMFDLAHAMNEQAKSQDFSKRILVEPYSDASIIAAYYNNVTQSFNQISSEKETLMAESIHMANYDLLTGLAKRRLMVAELGKSILRLQRQAQTNALFFIDLDGFKPINDDYGHDAGDLILKEAAHRIQAAIRKVDLASRFGGDEFVVLLENIQNDSYAATVADKILHSMQTPVELPCGAVTTVNASIGFTLFNGQTQYSVDDLLKQADQAMYTAKKRGKGQWVIY